MMKYLCNRVPIAVQRYVPSTGFFRVGFASNIGFLMWCVCGGVLAYSLECNFLTLLMKPSWDKPIRTISDLLERNFSQILWPETDYFIDVMENSPVEIYNKESIQSDCNFKSKFFMF